MTKKKSIPHGIMFHHFHGKGHPKSQGSITAKQFIELLHFIGREHILNADEFQKKAARGQLKAGDLCLTFDDNLRCQYDIAFPILQKFHITAFWFIYTSVLKGAFERLEMYRKFRTTSFPTVDAFYKAFFQTIQKGKYRLRISNALKNFNPNTYLAGFPFYSDADRRFRFVRDDVLDVKQYEDIMDVMIEEAGLRLEDLAINLWMDAACLRKLAKTENVIGLHSHTHPTRMGEMSPVEQEKEYRLNFDGIFSAVRRKPTTMSHPCNSYDGKTLRILNDLGITLGFRANMAIPKRSNLEFPREDHTNLVSAMKRSSF